MEIEKLIEALRGKCAVCKRSSCNGKYWELSSCPATCEAATALEQLQAENDRLKEEVQQMRWIPVEESPPEEIGNYAYPPAHIDRKAWEPCEMCGGKKTLYQHTTHTNLYMNTFGEAATLVTECIACPPYANCCMKDISANSVFKIDFCPNCGRPLTEEAWQEFEKKVMG